MEYAWKPLKCISCKVAGHIEESCPLIPKPQSQDKTHFQQSKMVTKSNAQNSFKPKAHQEWKPLGRKNPARRKEEDASTRKPSSTRPPSPMDGKLTNSLPHLVHKNNFGILDGNLELEEGECTSMEEGKDQNNQVLLQNKQSTTDMEHLAPTIHPSQ